MSGCIGQAQTGCFQLDTDNAISLSLCVSGFCRKFVANSANMLAQGAEKVSKEMIIMLKHILADDA